MARQQSDFSGNHTEPGPTRAGPGRGGLVRWPAKVGGNFGLGQNRTEPGQHLLGAAPQVNVNGFAAAGVKHQEARQRPRLQGKLDLQGDLCQRAPGQAAGALKGNEIRNRRAIG